MEIVFQRGTFAVAKCRMSMMMRIEGRGGKM